MVKFGHYAGLRLKTFNISQNPLTIPMFLQIYREGLKGMRRLADGG